MNIYLASPFVMRPLMRDRATQVEELGHFITSRWIYVHDDVDDEELDQATRTEHAEMCKHDVMEADVLIYQPGGPQYVSRGGKDVELGMASILDLPILIIAPGPTHIFRNLEAVELFPTWENVLHHLEACTVRTCDLRGHFWMYADYEGCAICPDCAEIYSEREDR